MSDESTRSDGVEFFPIAAPFEISTADLEAAQAFGEGVRARYDQAIAEMRQREDGSVFDNAMAVMKSFGDQPPLPPQHRILEHRTAAGERMLLLVPEPEPISVPPLIWPLPAPSPFEFVPQRRLGGCITWPDPTRIVCTSMPTPTAPGVEAMLADGWVWTGWHRLPGTSLASPPASSPLNLPTRGSPGGPTRMKTSSPAGSSSTSTTDTLVQPHRGA